MSFLHFLDLLISGAIGGFIAAVFRKTVSKLSIIISVVTGAACSQYLTPLVINTFGLTEALSNSYGFIIGLISYYLVDGLIQLINAFSKDPDGTVEKIIKVVSFLRRK